MSLIEVHDLHANFYSEEGVVRAVDGVDFTIAPKKTLGVVGESGCGKSVTALSIMGLLPFPQGRIAGGQILFKQKDKLVDLARLNLKGSEMRAIRGNEIAMIFQEPMTALNPVLTIGNQIVEAITLHQGLSKNSARERAIDMLDAVGISSPRQRIDEYPHQLSGGMRQRVMIAMALSCNPSLLIADEPTTALDVTIQAQVLDLMLDLRADFKMSIMFITHDLGVIAYISHDVIVMYLGRIVEAAPVKDIFSDPLHPYTKGLLASIPSLTDTKGKRLTPIGGSVPKSIDAPEGCGFEPRCIFAEEMCRIQQPPLTLKKKNHTAACWLYKEHRNEGGHVI